MKMRSHTLAQALFFFTIAISSHVFASQPPPYTMVVVGDSLTEGYGIPKEKAYPALIEKKFSDSGVQNFKVINAGISGSTSSSLSGRLNWILKTKPNVILLQLGANDGLRGVAVATMKKNLDDGIKKIKEAGIEVILVGMKMPPNYGQKYADDFEKVFVDLAKENKIRRIPFLLERTAGNKDLTQPDGLHPNEKGQIVIADYVFNELRDLNAELLKTRGPKKKLMNPNEIRPKNE